MRFKEAQKYIEELRDKKHAGYSDWRLPTLEEAMSLMERDKNEAGLYIASVFDKGQNWIWTADKETASRAWYVDFNFGNCNSIVIGFGYNDVRAVS